MNGQRRQLHLSFARRKQQLETNYFIDDERQTLRVQTEVVMLKLVRSELMLTDPMLVLEDMGLNEPAEDDTSAIDGELDSFEKASLLC